MNPRHLRELIVRPVLKELDLWSEAAEELVMRTAAQESRLDALRQYGGGPALGLWQMEPATHRDIWVNWLRFRPSLSCEISLLVPGIVPGPGGSELLGGPRGTRQLVGNLPYAAAMCRIHYLRKPGAIPAADDVAGQAAYWKQHYNTPLGHGTEEQFVHSAMWLKRKEQVARW